MAWPAAAIVGAAAIGAAAQHGGSAIQAYSQQMANQENLDAARDLRNWQKKMSDTAHQREVRDLRLAGLNPILSATGGTGAAMGSGIAGHVESPLSHNPGEGMSSAGAAMAQNVIRADIDQRIADAEIDHRESQVDLNESTGRVADAQTLLHLEHVKSAPVERQRIIAEIGRAQAGTQESTAHAAYLRQMDTHQQQENYARELTAQYEHYSGPITHFLKDVATVVGSAATTALMWTHAGRVFNMVQGLLKAKGIKVPPGDLSKYIAPPSSVTGVKGPITGKQAGLPRGPHAAPTKLRPGAKRIRRGFSFGNLDAP